MSNASASSTLALADDFPSSSEVDWRKRVEAVLKGADFEERLYSRTADDIVIAPLYPAGAASETRRPVQTPWRVMQRADHPDPARANAQALDDLTHGAIGLHLVFAGAPSAYGFGLTTLDRKGIERLLQDIQIDAIDLYLDAGPHGAQAAGALAQWIEGQPVNPERLRLNFGLDPIADGATRGQADPDFMAMLRSSVDALRARSFAGPFAQASGIPWHDAGASEAQELAFMLATGVAYLRALDHLGDESLKGTVALALAADQDMFLTLAKFRAARLLWSRVLAASGLRMNSIILHGETSWRMMTALDAHTNILRATAAVFGAALGGADQITVLPFSLAQGLPDAFARRIARNTQTILQEESQLWRVGDPASGSGYVEHLTQSLCVKAWSLFQDIERQGGIVAFINGGRAAALVAENRRRLLARIEEQAQTIIGVTAYRPPREMPPAIEDIPRAAAPAPRLSQDFEIAEAMP